MILTEVESLNQTTQMVRKLSQRTVRENAQSGNTAWKIIGPCHYRKPLMLENIQF